MSEAKRYDEVHLRYDAVHLRYGERNIRFGEGCEVEVVAAYDYDKLAAERDQLRAELAEIRASEPVAWIIKEHPTEFNDFRTRYRAVLDKPKYGTPLYTTQQPQPDVQALVEALEEVTASLEWNAHGRCRGVNDGPIMPSSMAVEFAQKVLAAYRKAP